MADNIHLLPTKLVSDKLSIIAILDYLTERTNDGEIEALAFALVTKDGTIDAACSETDSGPAILGAASLLHSRILKALDGD